MLMATLLALMLYFGGGPEGSGIFGQFMTQYVEAPIKKVVTDEKRREETLASLAKTKKDIAAFNTALQNDHAAMEKLLKDYRSTPEQFSRTSAVILDKSEQTVHLLWQDRAAMLKSITPDEWDAIVAEAQAAEKAKHN